jgi:SpoVK/Ycf46/Vps4 family AAA+-type ATPase
LLQTIFCIHQKVPVPRTFLMSGPAGVGKTYSVKRVMELCPLPLHLVSLRGSEVLQNRANASQGLEGEFQTAAKLKEKAVIVFLDECDALVSVESAAATLSTLLDMVSTEWTNLLFVGATNRIDSIPEYLRRAGRLDKEIRLSPPIAKERATILTSLLEQQVADGQNTVPSDDFTSIVNHVAELCVGYVPADLNALIRKATLLAKEQGPHASVVNFVEGAMSEVAPSALRDALLAAPPKITWEDIAGDPGGAKTALRQAIEWPRTKSALFSRLGLIPPRGILLHGPPGCAKTTLARAAAGASGVAFLSLSPAQVYSSSYVGEAEAVVRRAFSLARSAAPCVVFFDEIDSIFGGAQDGGRGGSSEARVLSTFLNEMDGVDNKSGTDGVLVLGATNRPWTLDSALVRPGRLGDKVIYVPPPDPAARRAILEMQFPSQIQQMDLDWLSDDAVTGLMTGAELVGACQEAKLVILRSIIQKADNQSMDEFRIREELVTVLRSRKPLLSNPDVFNEYRMFDRRTAGT